jgi:hypothetical protein
MFVQLENWRYLVEMGAGIDAWRLTGEAYDHPNFHDGEVVHTSTPVAFDATTRQLKTASGRTYVLGQCAANENEQIKNIMEDIERTGTLHL